MVHHERIQDKLPDEYPIGRTGWTDVFCIQADHDIVTTENPSSLVVAIGEREVMGGFVAYLAAYLCLACRREGSHSGWSPFGRGRAL